jgi:hypothetical protein
MDGSDPWAIDLGLVLATIALVLSLATSVVPFIRRPRVSLAADNEGHSRVEGNDVPHLRLPISNGRWLRSARRVRVVLDGYKLLGTRDPLTRLASPFLAWPSIFGQDSDSYVEVIFPGVERPVGLGQFFKIRRDPEGRVWREAPHLAPLDQEAKWCMHLDLAGGFSITDDRDWLSPGVWSIRLIVGAEDGEARTYEVEVSWGGDQKQSADDILASAMSELKVRRVG